MTSRKYTLPELTETDILLLELHTSYIVRHAGSPFLQKICAAYYGWKARRKYLRYKASKKERERVVARQQTATVTYKIKVVQ